MGSVDASIANYFITEREIILEMQYLKEFLETAHGARKTEKGFSEFN